MTDYYLPGFDYCSGERAEIFHVSGASVEVFSEGQTLGLSIQDTMFNDIILYSRTKKFLDTFRKEHGYCILGEFNAELKGEFENINIFNNFIFCDGIFKAKGFDVNHSDFPYVRGFDLLKSISVQLIKKGELNPIMHQNLEKIINYNLK